MCLVYTLVGGDGGTMSSTTTKHTTTHAGAVPIAAGPATAGYEGASGSRQWPDDLIDIVHEPMGQTLERMKKYSTSMGRVEQPDGEYAFMNFPPKLSPTQNRASARITP